MSETNRIGRREFLAASAITAGSIPATLCANERDVRSLMPEDFESRIGEAFYVKGERLVLRKCKEQKLHRRDARPAGCRQRPFRLLFEFREGQEIATDGIVEVMHRSLGRFAATLNRTYGPNRKTNFVSVVFG